MGCGQLAAESGSVDGDGGIARPADVDTPVIETEVMVTFGLVGVPASVLFGRVVPQQPAERGTTAAFASLVPPYHCSTNALSLLQPPAANATFTPGTGLAPRP